jgi:hypothetical protein
LPDASLRLFISDATKLSAIFRLSMARDAAAQVHLTINTIIESLVTRVHSKVLVQYMHCYLFMPSIRPSSLVLCFPNASLPKNPRQLSSEYDSHR